VPPCIPHSAGPLAEFSGGYRSPYLQTTYSLYIKDGQLVAGHPRNPDTHLEPLESTNSPGTSGGLGRSKFERDEKKKITGFILFGSRVRHLRFVKQ
jgi:hypothetical protein